MPDALLDMAGLEAPDPPVGEAEARDAAAATAARVFDELFGAGDPPWLGAWLVNDDTHVRIEEAGS